MNTKVTEEGVLIPKRWLQHVDEVEIRRENGIILIIPVESQGYTDTVPAVHDPLFKLGQHPIDDELPDISMHSDKYIYK